MTKRIPKNCAGDEDSPVPVCKESNEPGHLSLGLFVDVPGSGDAPAMLGTKVALEGVVVETTVDWGCKQQR